MPRGIAAASGFAYVLDSVGQTQSRPWRTDSSDPVATYPAPLLGTAMMRAVGDRVVFDGPYQSSGSSIEAAIFRQRRYRGRHGARAAGSRSATGQLVGHRGERQSPARWQWQRHLDVDPAARTLLRTGDGMEDLTNGDGAELAGALISSDYSYASGSEVFRSDGQTPVLLHDVWQSTAGGISSYARDAVAIGDNIYLTHAARKAAHTSCRCRRKSRRCKPPSCRRCRYHRHRLQQGRYRRGIVFCQRRREPCAFERSVSGT